MRSSVVVWLSVAVCVSMIAVAALWVGLRPPTVEQWEYGELGMRGDRFAQIGSVWWEEGTSEAKTIRVTSITLLGQKLGSTSDVTHTTGLVNLLAAQGWEPILASDVGNYCILFRRPRPTDR